jgi:hypothetical protein
LCEDEFASQDELLLYFYPPGSTKLTHQIEVYIEVELNKKLFLLGGCSAMISFAKSFSNQPVEVIKMEK